MARQGPEARKAARAAYKHAAETSAPGEGSRFAAVKKAAAAGGARDPGAVAAAIGRRKFGAKRFAQMAAKGRRKG